MNKKRTSKESGGFSLIEILLGIAIFAAIFLMATSLVVNLFKSTGKGKQEQTLEQVKNDLQAEFGNTVRWADSIAFIDNELLIDNNSYLLQDGKIYRNGEAITPSDVEIIQFDVSKRAAREGVENSAPGSGLTGQYFDNVDFTNLVFSQTDFDVNFDWGEESPDSLLDSNSFSIRHTGQFYAPTSGQYTFYVQSDDGARLWVNDDLIIDNWGIPGYSESSGRIYLSADKKYDVRLEYYEDHGNAQLSLLWAYPGQEKQVIPTAMLYPRSGSVSLEIYIGMRHTASTSLVDNLKLTLSPRSGDIGTIEND